MRITLDVELLETELEKASEIQRILADAKGRVEVNIWSNKAEMSQRINCALENNIYDTVKQELAERFRFEEIFAETVEIFCNAALFSIKRLELERPVEPFVEIIISLPEELRNRVKTEVVKRAMYFLSTPRRLDCSRVPLLPYAETLASMTRCKLLSVRSVVLSLIEMIRSDATRSAGMTCLGKLVEKGYALVNGCEEPVLSALRSAVAVTQQDDAFVYDVEYIMDSLGWSCNTPMLTLIRSGVYHTCPILALAYCNKSNNGREMVITSSANCAISIWDSSATQIENISLAHHYAASLDVANSSRFMIVGGVGQQLSIKPAVVLYHEEESANGYYWCEKKAVEPANGKFITCVRVVSDATPLQYCVGLHNRNGSNVMNMYYDTQLIHTYDDHTDLITAMHSPSSHDGSIVITGSRDCSMKVYDLRTHRVAASITHHSAISAISSSNEYIVSGGLDKRVVVQDLRMLTCSSSSGYISSDINVLGINNTRNNGNSYHERYQRHEEPVFTRSMDSPVLSLSVNSAMKCAIATLTGLHYIDFASGASQCQSSRAFCGDATPRYNALAWNADGNYLFCGGDNFTLDIYKRQPLPPPPSALESVGSANEQHTSDKN